MEKGNHFTLLVGMQTSTATMENSVEISYFSILDPEESPWRGAWWAIAHGVTESDRTEQLSTAQHHLGSSTLPIYSLILQTD